MPPKELWEAYSNHTVRPSFPLRVLCISPIFFEIGIPKFGVWMHLGMVECRVTFSGHCGLNHDL